MSALLLALMVSCAALPCERGDVCGPKSTCVQGECRSGSARAMVKTLAKVAVPRAVLSASTPALERRAADLIRHVEHALDWTGFYEVLPLLKHPRTPRVREISESVRAIWRAFNVERVLVVSVRKGSSPGSVFALAEVVDTQGLGLRRLGREEVLIPPGGDRLAVAQWINALVGDDTGLPSALGSRILVSVEVARGRKEIALIEADGAALSFVTRNGSINVTPAWGPSGAVGYMSYLRGNPDWVVNGIPFSTRSGLNAAGAWSPDGALLALSVAEDANSDLVLLDAKSGEERRRLTRHSGVDTSPTWSPKGTKLAFVSDREGTPQVWIMDLQSGDMRALSRGGYAASPVWSPLGESIVYVQMYAGKGVLFRHDLDTGQVSRLTDMDQDADSPTISSDGRHVVFVRRAQGGKAALWRVPVFGGASRPLAQQAWPLYAPDWQH